MQIRVCTAKIHRATVTKADLNYIGSITIDQAILDASGILPFQMVQITNLSNGTLWQTYVLAGEKHRGEMCLNGPPARHFQPGDKIIVLAEAAVDPAELGDLNPIVVFVDEKNRITEVKKHRAIPLGATNEHGGA
ncbi:MAG: aspartate 1-decarboxylase [Parcubacteria group bacterium 21-54-25]|nr:MAG: aspartate 1-decarboxylase [Parcubacteria group bacterium 21-54-25]HQU07690.1 aspartate 1-decarboxylase [Candidatus Paceibacterota bacterium]